MCVWVFMNMYVSCVYVSKTRKENGFDKYVKGGCDISVFILV